jgi:hypothetical protein
MSYLWVSIDFSHKMSESVTFGHYMEVLTMKHMLLASAMVLALSGVAHADDSAWYSIIGGKCEISRSGPQRFKAAVIRHGVTVETLTDTTSAVEYRVTIGQDDAWTRELRRNLVESHDGTFILTFVTGMPDGTLVDDMEACQSIADGMTETHMSLTEIRAKFARMTPEQRAKFRADIDKP